jgi:protein involved in polysaccharide export with SLBB domain
VEIARMIIAEKFDDNDLQKAEVFNIEITPENNEQSKNFELKPFDVISIRRIAMYEKPEMVAVSGAINYPGKYALVNKKDRLSILF